jgi:hypothetical protein
MTGKWSVLTIVLALFAGFAGGAVSGHYVMRKQAMTEKEPEQMNVLIGEELQLVGRDGTKRAVFGVQPGGELALVLLNRDGKAQALFGVTSEGVPFLEMLNEEAKVIWSAP